MSRRSGEGRIGPHIILVIAAVAGIIFLYGGKMPSPIAFVALNVTGCQIINTAGDYALNASVTNTTHSCIRIDANDVVFDCNGFTLDGGTLDNGLTGINVTRRTNVTIRGCVIRGYNPGVLFSLTNNSIIGNNTNGGRMNQITIAIYSSDNNTIVNNTANDNTDQGIYLWNVHNTTVRNNTANNNTNGGVTMDTSYNNTILGNIVNSNNNGVVFLDGNYTFIINNTARDNFATGIAYQRSKNGTIINNIVIAGGTAGLYIQISNSTLIENNSVNNSAVGVWLDTSVNNSIIRNSVNNHTSDGIYLFSSSTNSSIFNNTVTSNVGAGIFLTGSSHNGKIINNTLRSNGGASGAIRIESSNSNAILNNIILNTSNGASGTGIRLLTSDSNNILNNLVNGTTLVGIYTANSDNNVLAGNTLTFNLQGTWLGSAADGASEFNLVENNTFSRNTQEALIFENAGVNTVRHNTVNFGATGIWMYSGSNWNSFFNNTINATTYGIYVFDGSTGNNFNNSIVQNSSLWDFFSDSTTQRNNATSLDVGGFNVSFISAQVSIKTNSTTLSAPSSYQSLHKYLNITNNSVSGWLALNASYTSADASGYTESTITLARYSGTSWTTNPTQFSRSGSSGLDTARKVAYANITTFSIFALVGQPAPASSSAPIVSSPVRIIKEETEETVEELFMELCGVEPVGTAGPTGATVSAGTKRITASKTVTKQKVTTASKTSISSKSLSTLIKPARTVPETLKTVKLNTRVLREVNCTINPNKVFETVKFNVTRNMTGAPIDIKAVPEPEAAAPGSTFEYVEISHVGIQNWAFKSATIDFGVEKSWLLSNSIDPGSVVLRRFSGGEWENFTAVKLNETDTTIFYRASAPGLSLFAIGGEAAIVNKTCPVCPKDTAWSACGGGKQSRVAWTCDGDTNFACKPVLEGKSCAACTTKCDAPTKFSACTDNRMSRTVQKCGEETGLVCKNFRDSRVCGCPAENEDIIAAAQAAIRTAEKTCKDITVASLLLADALTAPDCDLAALMAEQARLAAVGAEGGCLKAGLPLWILLAVLLIILLVVLLWKRRKRKKVNT